MKPLKFTLCAWPAVTALTVGACQATQAVASLCGFELPDQANVELVRKYAGWNLTFAILCLQVVALMPAIEELVFRWLLYGKTRKWIGVWAAAVASSALFTAAHYWKQPFPDAAFVALFFFGLAQCWLYSRTRRLWCAMLNHALFNTSNLALLFLVPPPAA